MAGGIIGSLLGGRIANAPNGMNLNPSTSLVGNALLPGFYSNGATNPKLRAAIQRVQTGTGRAKLVMKGDSTTVGQGAGTTADSFGLTGARPNRIASVLAGLLTAAGTPTHDAAVMSDNGMWNANNFSIITYDPRVAAASPFWTITQGQAFAGGGFLSTNSGALSFTPDYPVDTFEVAYFNSAACVLLFAIDGKVPASGPPSATITAGSGFTKVTLGAGALGNHTLAMTASNTAAAVRYVLGYNSAQPSLDILVHASLGATSVNQAATNGSWDNQEALAFDAPDLTTINLGLNDMNTGVSVASYAANLQAIIATAKASGDVLLLFPTPAAENYNAGVAAFHAAAKAIAASNGVSFLSLLEHYGMLNSTFQARLFDNTVHPNAALYCEIAGLYKAALQLMTS